MYLSAELGVAGTWGLLLLVIDMMWPLVPPL
jgi:hypothetical protein